VLGNSDMSCSSGRLDCLRAAGRRDTMNTAWVHSPVTQGPGLRVGPGEIALVVDHHHDAAPSTSVTSSPAGLALMKSSMACSSANRPAGGAPVLRSNFAYFFSSSRAAGPSRP
jgi:hypothetical protein